MTHIFSRAPSYISGVRNTARRIVLCVFVCVFACIMFLPSESSCETVFPDTLKNQYGSQDFALRSAEITGNVRFLERHYAGIRGIDGRAALMELYHRADLTNELRRAAHEYRALLKQQPASAWKGSRLHLALARSHEYIGEWSEALQSYRRGLEYQVSASAWERVMEMELNLARPDAAEAACRSWLAARKANERVRRQELARLYERLGAKNVAAETYARACEQMPLVPALLEGYLRSETSPSRRVAFAVRVLARDGHNLSTVQNTVEALIAQGRAAEARQILEGLSSFFSSRKSSFWALMAARASAAAEDWERAAFSFRQARLWRANAPAEERAYYLVHEAEGYARLGRAGETEALLALLPTPLVWDEDAFFVRLRLLCATNAPAERIETFVAQYASKEGRDNQTTYFMTRLSDFSELDALSPLVESLWLSHVQKKGGAIAAYEAGRYFLRIGKSEKAYELLQKARSGMRAFGELLPYLAIAAERLGRDAEALEYRASACYLLGRAAWIEMRSDILARLSPPREEKSSDGSGE